jgi:hypothetical protein
MPLITQGVDDCERRPFPEDAVWVAVLVAENSWLTSTHIRTLYTTGELCHWKVGRKVFVSKADFLALLDAGLNASQCKAPAGGA